MFRAVRRVAVASAVVAVFCGVLLQRADTGSIDVLNSDPRSSSTVLAESVPVGVMPAAVRGRGALVDVDALLGASSKRLDGGYGLVAAGLLLAAALVSWRLMRPDRRVAAPLLRSCMAPLRAPPASV